MGIEQTKLNVKSEIKDIRYQLSCGKGKIDLSKLIPLMKKGLVTLSNAKDNSLFLVIGNTGAGKSATINYVIGNSLKRVNYGSLGLEHGPGLQLLFDDSNDKVNEIYRNWRENSNVGSVSIVPSFKGDFLDQIEWKLVLICNEEKEIIEINLNEEEIQLLELQNISSLEDAQEYNLDNAFYYIRDKEIFKNFPLNFSSYTNKLFPEFKESTESQTTIASTYIDIQGNAITDCAGFGDTRVLEFLENGEVVKGTPEDALMSTMSVKMTIDQAKEIKGLIVVMPSDEITAGRSKLFLDLLKSLSTIMPELKNVDELKTLGEAMTIVITKIPIELNGGLSIAKVKNIENSLERMKNQMDKNIKEQTDKSTTEKIIETIRDRILPNEKIEDLQKKLKENIFLNEDIATLEMLKIICNKIKEKKIVYINPTDNGQSRQQLFNQLTKVRSKIAKDKFHFVGANKVHEAFIGSVSLVATRANELIDQRDNEIPKEIDKIIKDKEQKNDLLKSQNERIELLKQTIQSNQISFDVKKNMIVNLDEQIATIERQIKTKETEKADLGKEIKLKIEKKEKLENDKAVVYSDWEAHFTDKREKRNSIFLLKTFEENSKFTIEQKFDYPYEKIIVYFGYSLMKDSLEWGRFLKVITDDKEKGIYKAEYNCNSWYEKHPPIGFMAMIQNKYHPRTKFTISEIQQEVDKKESKLSILDREISDLNTNKIAKIVERQSSDANAMTITSLETILCNVEKECELLKKEIEKNDNTIFDLRNRINETQSIIDSEYKTFQSIIEIIKLTNINEPIILRFQRQFDKLKNNNLRQQEETDVSNKINNSELMASIGIHASRRNIDVIDIQKLKDDMQNAQENNDINLAKNVSDKAYENIASISNELLALKKNLEELQAKMSALETKRNHYIEIYNNGKEMIEKDQASYVISSNTNAK